MSQPIAAALTEIDVRAGRGPYALGGATKAWGRIDVGLLQDRPIDLPPFLADLLRQIMEGHPHEQVFVTGHGQWLRRSNFSRRIWRPACDGTAAPTGDAAHDGDPLLNGAIIPGATFHGLRHLHKSVLLEAGIPRVLQYDRLGHELGGIEGVYSHVTGSMRDHLIAELQHRWTTLTTAHGLAP